MGGKFIFVRVAVIFLMITSFVVFMGSPVFAQGQCQVIRIDKSGGGAGAEAELSPKSATVSVGTCTVWVNFYRNMDVQVTFHDGRACEEATVGASSFQIFNMPAGEVCYASKSLILGKSASLVWEKPGEYEYTITATSRQSTEAQEPIGPVMTEGVVIVKEAGEKK